MKLAVNYSKPLLTLIDQNSQIPVDYIKVPTVPFPDCWYQFDEGEKKRVLLPHLAQPGIISLGRIKSDERLNPVIVREIIQRTRPKYLSTHLEAGIEFFPEYAGYRRQHHPVIQQVLLDHFTQAAVEVKDAIAIPLVLENFPYYGWGRHFLTVSHPDFISELCEHLNCGFLLDIAHARCTAWHIGMDIYSYLKGLPLDRLREIHLAGTAERAGEGLRDTHGAISHIDYELLKYVLQKTDPEIVTVEYGGMPDRIRNMRGEFEFINRNDIGELQQIIITVSQILGLT